MNAYQELLGKGLEHHKAGRFKEAEPYYQILLNAMPFDEQTNYLLSDLYLHREYNGLAINLLSNLLQNNKAHGPAWENLGIAWRKENQYDLALGCWNNAIKFRGETQSICNNMASLYADRAEPHKALEWLDKALKYDANDAQTRWGRALALLTLRQWEEGWKEYEWRRKIEKFDSRPMVVAPDWDGSHVGHLYIHGEQGVGDEVMFASALPFVKAQRITLEVNAKVATLMQKSFPDIDVVTEPTPGDYDAKEPLGSLVGRFGFNKEPYLKPDPWKVKHYREKLEAMGKGPYLALAWIGGMKQTRVVERSLVLDEFRPIMDAFTCVSAQHWHSDPMMRREVDEQMQANNLQRLDDGSCGDDLHDQAALFKAVDCVVTVQQTAVHVAGAVGAKTHCLIGTHPHWRYGLEGDSLPFYSTVKLHRKKTEWKEVVERVIADLRSL